MIRSTCKPFSGPLFADTRVSTHTQRRRPPVGTSLGGHGAHLPAWQSAPRGTPPTAARQRRHPRGTRWWAHWRRRASMLPILATAAAISLPAQTSILSLCPTGAGNTTPLAPQDAHSSDSHHTGPGNATLWQSMGIAAPPPCRATHAFSPVVAESMATFACGVMRICAWTATPSCM